MHLTGTTLTYSSCLTLGLTALISTMMMRGEGFETSTEYDDAVHLESSDSRWSAWDGYEATTIDPGIWLLVFTCTFCASVMLAIVPLLVCWKARRKESEEQADHQKIMPEKTLFDPIEEDPVESTFYAVVNIDEESRKILRIAIPFTLSGLVSASLSNICLAMVGRYIGTKAITAYAIVQILLGLTDEFLQGPIAALTTLCSHAVGAKNYFLAGQFVQLAILSYWILSLPAFAFWFNYMDEVVLFLEWGDQETAHMANDFTHVYIWSFLLRGISSGLWQLLEVADLASEVTIIRILGGVVDAAVIVVLVTSRESSLTQVGLCHITTSLFILCLSFAIAEINNWLGPFKKGLFGSFSLKNVFAIDLMITQALPLAIGSLFSHAEWATLTFFASLLGPAEVAAWAILGNIWEVFYSATSGIGDAAELRVGIHLGSNRPTMAKLAGYKALVLSMTMASIVSIVFFSIQDRIPGWFTVDATLQSMLRELIPFVGIANFTMQFGMTSWSLIGAQGKYRLATCVSFLSSWGICMPLAAVFTLYFRIDLQGLMSSVVIGYVTTGAALATVLLSTNWNEVARQIQMQNVDHKAQSILARDDEHSVEVEELLQDVVLEKDCR